MRVRSLAVVAVSLLLGTRLSFAQSEDDLDVSAAAPSASVSASVSAAPPPSAVPVTIASAARPDVHGVPDTLGLVVSGYVQAQFEKSALSEDQRLQGGSPLNQDRFLVRRGRLRVDRRWDLAAVAVEFDGSTTRGPFFGVRRAEASLIFAGKPGRGEPPLLTLTAGLTEIPFGHELVESSRFRWFMERSTASLAFFPGEPDVGVRLQGGFKFVRYALAVLNGEPLNDRAGQGTGGREFNAAKDIVARVGIDTDGSGEGKLRFATGVSFLEGKGFHPGTDATKGSVVWQDANENTIVDNGELRANPDVAATPSLNFRRWALGADFRVTLRTVLGLSRFAGEVYVASNLDRGTFFADPYAAGSTGDIRHVGWYAYFLQDIGRYAVAGLRADVYDPNSDVLDKRSGRLIPADQTITTVSPIIGAVLPDRARLLLQYDIVRDHLARDARGVPVDLKNNLLTVRLQVEL
jgi:hypothetical protein